MKWALTTRAGAFGRDGMAVRGAGAIVSAAARKNQPGWDIWGGSKMPKFLIEASYTAEGLKGLMKDRAAGRTSALKAALESVGGKLEAIYWSLGDADVYLIAEMPGTAEAASLAITASSSGLVRTKTTALLTAQELDATLGKDVSYRAPGR
jgi:uncharacterized protein with GYD domain